MILAPFIDSVAGLRSKGSSLQLGSSCSQIQRYAIITNSFLGYVVLDTFNNVSRNEDNILNQIYIYEAKMFGFVLS